MDNKEVFGVEKPIIGMVHLPPLPGAPLSDEDMREVYESAIKDARALDEGGIDAIIVENINDVPFYANDVPKHTVASMTAVVKEIQNIVDIPIGVNVLRNDTEAAVAIAKATGLNFIRVDIHTGARVTDQGIVQGKAQNSTRLRKFLDCDVNFLTDIGVKHSAPIIKENFAPETSVHDFERGLADGIIITSEKTGRSVDTEELKSQIHNSEHGSTGAPIFIGSGVTAENIEELLDIVDGVIVGTATKENQETLNPVSQEAVTELVDAVREN